MRGWKALTGAALLVLALTACGGGGAADTGALPGGDASSAASGGTAAEKVYAELNGMSSGARDAAIAGAKKEGSLTLYTSMNEDVSAAVAKAFTDQFGIKVNVFRASSETVLQRALQEGKANQTAADAIETNFSEMEALVHEKQLADYQGPALKDLPDIAQFEGWNADRYNVFLPAWNTDIIKPGDEPQSWEDLADPKYKGRMQIEVGDSDWFENLTKYWLEHGKTQDEVDALWKGIAANAAVAKGHATMIHLLAAGQTGIDGMNYTFESLLVQKEGAPVAFKGADGTTPIPAFPRPNGVSLVKAAPHPNAAWLFNDWLLSVDGQKVLVAQDQTPVTKVPGDTSLDGVTLVPFDVKGLSENAKEWATKYDQLLRGVKRVKS
ncbi:MAG TPA: extracellular solute-binding protein [Actinomycetales bacterium]|nr:extracellular solute-binding protein [Actinomycetales bacterium]